MEEQDDEQEQIYETMMHEFERAEGGEWPTG
jgi:hypothetical protein